jgi:hypothetical protein
MLPKRFPWLNRLYGPVNPHFGHLYKRPNLRHFPSRLIWISPQLGHWNFVDSLPGGIGLLQLVQVTKDNVLSVIREHFVAVLNCKGSLYLLCLEIVGLSVFLVCACNLRFSLQLLRKSCFFLLDAVSILP